MSSVIGGANPPHRKSKGSEARFVLLGLVGPKARPKGVADGHAVNIPRLPYVRCGDAALSSSLAMVSNDGGYEIRIGKSAGSSAWKSR